MHFIFILLQPQEVVGADLSFLQKAVSSVPIEIWGLPLSFFASSWSAFEESLWSLRRKIWSALSSSVFGWAVGFFLQNWWNLAPFACILVYLLSGVLGGYIAGGFKTLGIAFKRKPLETVTRLNDLKNDLLNKKADSNDGDDDTGGAGKPDNQS